MGMISELPLNRAMETITASNRQSAQKLQRYVFHENAVIQADYDFVACKCPPSCWCKTHGCTGHYVIREIGFGDFLDSYALLWLPPRARMRVKEAVLHGAQFNGRQRNAVGFLRDLHQNWDARLAQARSHRKTGLCDEGVPTGIRVGNLYEAKIWSQLFYDSLVPFDTTARARMIRGGYTNPLRDYSLTNLEMFSDLRSFSSRLHLGLPGIRGLDTPWTVAPGMTQLTCGQPLSRILDKLFYLP